MNREAEKHLVQHWAMWGAPCLVEKVGRKWGIVEWHGYKHPGLYRTKREAMAAVTAWALAIRL